MNDLMNSTKTTGHPESVDLPGPPDAPIEPPARTNSIL
jgi:hypothetical protein